MTKANGPETIEVNGKQRAVVRFEYGATKYAVRELSQDEIDQTYDAATGPDDKVNFRSLTRMQLAKAVVEPATTVDGLGELGSREFTTVLNHFNELHSLPAKVPTPPAG